MRPELAQLMRGLRAGSRGRVMRNPAAAQHAVVPGLVGARGVLRELALDFGTEVDPGHLGQASQVDEDVC
jgi:hypothetical protein